MTVRQIRPGDVPAVVALVRELADYEKAADQALMTEEQLHAALFGESPTLFGHVALVEEQAGFLPVVRIDVVDDRPLADFDAFRYRPVHHLDPRFVPEHLPCCGCARLVELHSDQPAVCGHR